MDHMAFPMPAMAPPLLNQPPQIFGAYTPDGIPMQHLPPEIAAQMFADPNGLLDDANEAKRRRIARVSTGALSAAADSSRWHLRALAADLTRHY